MAAVGPEEVERLKQEIIRLTQVLVILMKIIVTELMILMVNSSFSTGGRVFTTPGFTFSGLSFFSFSIFADFDPSVFFLTDAFLFSGSSTGGATDFGALLLFFKANLTCT